MTFIFAGGGTGGHLAPGIAVAEELVRLAPETDCLFVGAGRAIEQRLLSGTSFETFGLSARPLNVLKRQPWDFVRGNVAAIRAATKLLREHQPRAVIGLGGYASVPVVLAAAALRVPVWLLEQNAIPGRANRWLSHWFPICLTFPSSAFWLPQKARVFVTGNPLRRQLIDAFQPPIERPSGRPKTLLVMGGSQGSTGVNRDVIAVATQLRATLRDWRIIHQAGDAQCEAVRSSYAQLGLTADVQPFFSNVTQLYAQSRLIICRAGATTLTELALAGLPAILVPYPYSADQHQVENARVFTSAGASIAITERDALTTSRDLRVALEPLLSDEQRLDAMSASMRSLAQPRAAEEVARRILRDAQ